MRRLLTTIAALVLGIAVASEAQASNGRSRGGSQGQAPQSSLRSGTGHRGPAQVGQGRDGRLSGVRTPAGPQNGGWKVPEVKHAKHVTGKKHALYHDYHHKHGKKFQYGWWYHGKHHHHWAHSHWDWHWGCYFYYCPATLCYYYWCVPDSCYYPITYCPYGVYCW